MRTKTTIKRQTTRLVKARHDPGTEGDVSMTAEGYEKLAAVFQRAYNQAAHGKGKERHATTGMAFENQPMSSINQTLGGIDGFLYQAAKKAAEARRLPAPRAQAELLGAINYLAGAVIALDTWAAGTLPPTPVEAQ